MVCIVKLGPSGQLTVPKELQERLGLKPGDRFAAEVKNGQILLTPKMLTIDDIVGILPAPSRPVSIEEMNETIAEAASDMRD